jgi:hypothetical protein
VEEAGFSTPETIEEASNHIAALPWLNWVRHSPNPEVAAPGWP